MLKKVSMIFFVSVFTLTPVSFLSPFEYSQAEDAEIISSDQEWTTDKIIRLVP
jgi:hypothetical protein